MRTLLLLVVIALAAAADPARSEDRIESDQWFVGQLNGQPAISLHEVVTVQPDGRRRSAVDQVMVFRRRLGANESRFEWRQTQRLEEDREGRVVSFLIDDEQNGATTTATGAVTGGRVRGAVHRLGRSQPFDQEVPAGIELVSDWRARRDLVGAEPAKGAVMRFGSLGLHGGRLLIATCTATGGGRDADGDWLFTVVMDQAPLPMSMAVSPKGRLRRLEINLGVMALTLVPSPGPVALLGATVEANRVVTARGPAPRPTGTNRHRLPEGAVVPEDPFQRLSGRELTVSSLADPAPLADPASFLAAGPQIEIDDPALRGWAEGLDAGANADADERVERLRLGVRTHITRKDLAVNDGSALETYRSKHGDCTEHATLLCAALRVAGIPARIEVGLVYSADHGAWVGHAWNSAWVKGRWVHLDSAYPGVPRSCYIRLGGLGDPGATTVGAALITSLASLMGREIETLPAQAPASTAATAATAAP